MTAIDEIIQVDEDWWISNEIRRRYFQVRLQDGRRLWVFRDQLGGGWWA